MDYGFIYETTNLVTGKKYIGQHKRSHKCDTDPDDSWYLGSGYLICKAIEKYGAENFSRVILRECKSDEELNMYEKYYINVFNAVEDPMYYNMHEGGGSPGGFYKGKHLSETHRANISKSREGMSSGMKGKHQSDSAKMSISSSMKGREFTEEHRKRLSIVSMGNKAGCSLKGKPKSEDAKAKISETLSKKIWVTDGVSNERILPSMVDEYIAKGWRRGFTKSCRRKSS